MGPWKSIEEVLQALREAGPDQARSLQEWSQDALVSLQRLMWAAGLQAEQVVGQSTAGPEEADQPRDLPWVGCGKDPRQGGSSGSRKAIPTGCPVSSKSNPEANVALIRNAYISDLRARCAASQTLRRRGLRRRKDPFESAKRRREPGQAEIRLHWGKKPGFHRAEGLGRRSLEKQRAPPNKQAATMGLSRPSQGCLHSPTACPGMVARDPSPSSLLMSVKCAHHINDATLTCEHWPLPRDTADFAGTSARERMAGEPTEHSRPRYQSKDFRSRLVAKTCVVSEAVTEKVRACPSPGTGKRASLCRDVGLEDFCSHLAQCPQPSYRRLEDGHV